jgi:hypothetical protein
MTPTPVCGYEHDPIANDGRRARRTRKLGADAACTLCATTDPAVLERQRSRRLLEEHHVLGHTNDEALTIVLCRNCHARATARQHDAGVANSNTPEPATVLHQLDQALRALASFLQLLADTFLGWAHQLRGLTTALDHHHPGWSTLPQASPQP